MRLSRAMCGRFLRQTETASSGADGARLMSGLKLLETVLPLEEAIVFQPNEDGMLIASARLRSAPAIR